MRSRSIENLRDSVLFSYFLYLDDRDIHIGYGTQPASEKTLRRGRRIGTDRFETRQEAEVARMEWRKKFHITPRSRLNQLSSASNSGTSRSFIAFRISNVAAQLVPCSGSASAIRFLHSFSACSSAKAISSEIFVLLKSITFVRD